MFTGADGVRFALPIWPFGSLSGRALLNVVNYQELAMRELMNGVD